MAPEKDFYQSLLVQESGPTSELENWRQSMVPGKPEYLAVSIRFPGEAISEFRGFLELSSEYLGFGCLMVPLARNLIKTDFTYDVTPMVSVNRRILREIKDTDTLSRQLGINILGNHPGLDTYTYFGDLENINFSFGIMLNRQNLQADEWRIWKLIDPADQTDRDKYRLASAAGLKVVFEQKIPGMSITPVPYTENFRIKT